VTAHRAPSRVALVMVLCRKTTIEISMNPRNMHIIGISVIAISSNAFPLSRGRLTGGFAIEYIRSTSMIGMMGRKEDSEIEVFCLRKHFRRD
jgi:hypothetical protein